MRDVYFETENKYSERARRNGANIVQALGRMLKNWARLSRLCVPLLLLYARMFMSSFVKLSLPLKNK
jgi:hypothetical protein